MRRRDATEERMVRHCGTAEDIPAPSDNPKNLVRALATDLRAIEAFAAADP
jgi:hypothetical protein